MPAFYFGESRSPLFGYHHLPPGRSARDSAVLLCPPIGQEYVRCHWALRRLAGRLLRDGFHVLRFDYFGVGDSAGESGGGDVERWTADIRAAAQELRDVAGVRRVSLVGVRLGATLAARAVADGLEVKDLVLWDPVQSGRAHLDELRALHLAALEDPMRFPSPRREEGANLDELLGFQFPRVLRDSLASLELSEDLSRARGARRVVLIDTSQQPELDSVASALAQSREGFEQRVAAEAGDWTVLARLEEAVLATDIQQQIVHVLSAPNGGS